VHCCRQARDSRWSRVGQANQAFKLTRLSACLIVPCHGPAHHPPRGLARALDAGWCVRLDVDGGMTHSTTGGPP
jgi:hypothetical protein